MVQAIDPNLHDYWLDPCMGPGAFIAPLRRKGIAKERIVGIDIDPMSGAEDEAATTVRGVDFFKWCASNGQRLRRGVWRSFCLLPGTTRSTHQTFDARSMSGFNQ